ncbi:unnamed protein product [Allacma fusca]|uniref:SH2 domain-containing protein n=1 Tax=Allacma fusca TaxID=39272 RepID=A0A8J2K9I8_9HEXA|nr:unnamed protein product [Allacma fusca]
MGRWAGLSSWIDLNFERGSSSNSHSGGGQFHRHGLPAVNFSTRYSKLDDSIFVLCRNCGHCLKTDELKKMAAYAGTTATTGPTTAGAPNRLRPSPKQFLTWSASAANHRLQKMSRNIVNNVSKLQTKMERVLPTFHASSSSTASPPSSGPSSGGNPRNSQNSSSCSSLSDGGFIVLGSSSNKINTCVNNNFDSDDSSSSVGGDCKRSKLRNSHRTFPSRRPDTSSNILQNSFLLNSNNFCDSKKGPRTEDSFELTPSSGTGHLLSENRKLVKDFVEENNMLEIRQLSPQHQQCFYGSKHCDSSEGCRSNNNSSSSISTSATVPITSPQWSRASSISICSTNQCDNNGSPHQPNNSKSCHGNGTDCPSSPLLFASSSDPSSPLKSPLKTLLCSSSTTLPTTKTATTTTITSSSASSPSQTLLVGGQDEPKVNNSTLSTTPPSSTLTTTTSTFPNSNSNLLTVTIFEEEAELRHAPWFQAGIPREIALEVLRNEPIGSFIVRESTTKTGCFALSLRVPREFQPTGIAHYLILKTGRGYKIKGFTKEFGSLTSLITHHSVMPELLPCPLSLHLYRPKHTHRVSRLHSSDFVEPEKLITFRKFTDF